MHEHQPQDLERRTFLVSAADYQRLLDHHDEATLIAGFVGRWASRDAFGVELLEDAGAPKRLEALPGWLQSYVRLDGAAYADELERTGLFVITPVDSGVCVFDAAVIRPRRPSADPA